ncbi:MAG: serine/threonine-protein kinase [Rhodospirillaceae bacterium]|nr:serine/threonine-protein kinase [Rhodospirillaceae bacterium]
MNEPFTHLGALTPGTRLGEFEFRHVLGHGGFGVTYLGWDTVLQSFVAIKEYMPAQIAVRGSDLTVLPKSRDDEQDYRWGLDRFLDEARMLARFDHPGIVRVRRFFEAHGTAYIVMEHLEGHTLSAVYQSENVLDEARLRAILTPILDALEQVHAADFLHRDIKPGNIMFRADGMPALIDFGAARTSVALRSQTVTAIVTPGYSPIEQYSTSRAIKQGPPTDIYSVGAVLYRGITGTVPDDATARIVDDGLVPTGQAKVGKYGKSFTDAVDWALQLRSEDRPQSVAEWRGRLETGAARRRPAASVPSADKPAAPARQRSKAPLYVALSVAALLVAGSAVVLSGALDGLTGGDLSSKVSEVRDLLARGDRAGAQRALAEARSLGLDAQTEQELAAAIDRAQRLAAAIAAFRQALARPDFAAARAALDRARSLRLPEDTYRNHLTAIERRRSEAVQRSVDACATHESAGRLPAALACYRAVLERQADHAVAKNKVRELVPKIAWTAARKKNTVEAYHGFLQAHGGSAHAGAARQSLGKLEVAYWRLARKANTQAAYAQYLKIYPNGIYAEIARKRFSQPER